MIPENRIFYPTIDELELSSGLESMALVHSPAMELEFLTFNKEEEYKLQLSSDDKMIVSGPALIPNKKVYRNDEKFGDYWLEFTADLIRDIVEKYFTDGKINNINNDHLERRELINGVMIESWFSKVENELGYPTPIGTWYVTYKIKDKDYWNDYIKTGKVKGFSIEGLFKLKNKEDVKADLSIDEDERIYNEVKAKLLAIDEELIIEYFSSDNIGLRLSDLDLSEVSYDELLEDEYTSVTLATPDVFYYYWKKPSATFNGSATLTDDKTRDFCKKIVGQAKYYSASEIVALSSTIGYSVFSFAGGNNCRHQWVKANNFKFLPRK